MNRPVEPRAVFFLEVILPRLPFVVFQVLKDGRFGIDLKVIGFIGPKGHH